MNNRGFTLVEVLGALALISIVLIILFRNFGTTMSVSKEEAYELMKNNIISAGYDYVNECKLGTIECDFSFDNNNTFSVQVLKNAGFFNDFKSPVDGRDLSSCLVIEVFKVDGTINLNLVDNCY